jgi:probable phosphoglycerate mutase
VRIVLVRHGHVPGIEPERFRGGAHLQLTELGLREAQLTALRIARHWQPAIVYTSSRQRCISTGSLIAERCAVANRVLDGIYDLDYGDWTDRTHEEIRAAHPAQYRRWRTQPQLVRFPGGNSLQEVAARMADALRFVVQAHPDSTVVMVGHDSGNRALMLHALGLPLSAYWQIKQAPCGISEFIVDDDGVQVIRMNETAHLEQPSSMPPDGSGAPLASS